MGLELLTALAEESEVQLARAARTAMLESIGEAAPEVLQLLGAVLTANLAVPGGAAMGGDRGAFNGLQ